MKSIMTTAYRNKKYRIRILQAGILTAVLFILLAAPPSVPAREDNLQLGIPLFTEDIGMTAEFVDQLKELVRPDDIIFVRNEAQGIEFLKRFEHGRIAVTSYSLAGLREGLDLLTANKIKAHYLCYSPHLRPDSPTPVAEEQNLLWAVQEARDLARKKSMQLIVISDAARGLSAYGPKLARLADMVGIDFQQWQKLPTDEFRTRALAIIRSMRSENPDIKILAQMSTIPPTGDVTFQGIRIFMAADIETMHAMFTLIAEDIDCLAFSIKTEREGLSLFMKFLKTIRPPAADSRETAE